MHPLFTKQSERFAQLLSELSQERIIIRLAFITTSTDLTWVNVASACTTASDHRNAAFMAERNEMNFAFLRSIASNT